MAEDGSHLGFVNPDDLSGSGPPDGFEALLLGTLTEIAALGLELRRADAARRRSAAVAQAQRRQLEDLIAASLEVRGEGALDDALADIARAMATAVGFRRAAVYLMDGGAGQSTIQASAGLDPAQDACSRNGPYFAGDNGGARTSRSRPPEACVHRIVGFRSLDAPRDARQPLLSF